MISEKMIKHLNEQLNKEFYSAYLYLSMSAYFEKMGFCGFAHWMKIQAAEEKEHGMIIYKYLLEQDANIEFTEIQAPDKDFLSPHEVFERALIHEKTITESINKISELAEEEHDRITLNITDWFIKEQLEEEVSLKEIIRQLNYLKDDKCALIMLNEKLHKREIEHHCACGCHKKE